MRTSCMLMLHWTSCDQLIAAVCWILLYSLLEHVIVQVEHGSEFALCRECMGDRAGGHE